MTMDHGTAHERIEDLVLDPVRLSALETSDAPDDAALREHLAGCPACQADLDGWARLQSAIGDALPGAAADASAVVQPVELPPSLRARVLASVRSSSADAPLAPIRMAPGRRRWSAFSQPRTAWVSMAAALVVLVIGAGILVGQARSLDAARDEAASLGQAMAAVDRVLSTEHTVVPLRTTSGDQAGTISWSRHDWVVLTSALPTPATGQQYLCWLEAGAKSVPVGRMDFSDGIAYWVATVDEWKTWEIGPTTQFVVSLESGTPASRTGDVILSANLGS